MNERMSANAGVGPAHADGFSRTFDPAWSRPADPAGVSYLGLIRAYLPLLTLAELNELIRRAEAARAAREEAPS